MTNAPIWLCQILADLFTFCTYHEHSLLLLNKTASVCTANTLIVSMVLWSSRNKSNWNTCLKYIIALMRFVLWICWFSWCVLEFYISQTHFQRVCSSGILGVLLHAALISRHQSRDHLSRAHPNIICIFGHAHIRSRWRHNSDGPISKLYLLN